MSYLCVISYAQDTLVFGTFGCSLLCCNLRVSLVLTVGNVLFARVFCLFALSVGPFVFLVVRERASRLPPFLVFIECFAIRFAPDLCGLRVRVELCPYFDCWVLWPCDNPFALLPPLFMCVVCAWRFVAFSPIHVCLLPMSFSV